MNHIPPYSFRSREGDDEVRDIENTIFVRLHFTFNLMQTRPNSVWPLKYARTTGYSDNHSGDGLTRFQNPLVAKFYSQLKSSRFSQILPPSLRGRERGLSRRLGLVSPFHDFPTNLKKKLYQATYCLHPPKFEAKIIFGETTLRTTAWICGLKTGIRAVEILFIRLRSHQDDRR